MDYIEELECYKCRSMNLPYYSLFTDLLAILSAEGRLDLVLLRESAHTVCCAWMMDASSLES